MRMRRDKHIPLEVSDLRPCTDGKFTDSYGNEVKHGSRIIIESTYGGYNGNDNGEALVEWDEKKGMYNYVMVNDWLKSRDNFYGVCKFRVKNENETKENENGNIQTNQNQAVREVPLESFNQSA